MLRMLRLSLTRRRSPALAIVLAIFAAGALMAAPYSPLASSGRAGVPALGLGAALAQGVSAPAMQQVPADALHGIAVYGDGEATGAPDVAFVTVGVQTDGATARETSDKNSSAMAAVIEALKKSGVAETNLRTIGITLVPIRAARKPGDQGPAPVVSYQAQNTLNVTLEDVARAGDALDAAIGAGANVVGGIRFALNDDGVLRRKALDLAAKAARAKAETTAASLGLHITGVQSVAEENVGGVPVPRAALATEAAPAEAPPIQPGELTARVRVRAVFTFG